MTDNSLQSPTQQSPLDGGVAQDPALASCTASIASLYYSSYTATATSLFIAYQSSATAAAASSCPLRKAATLAVAQQPLPTATLSSSATKNGGKMVVIAATILGLVLGQF